MCAKSNPNPQLQKFSYIQENNGLQKLYKRHHNNQTYFRTETLHLGSMPSLTFGHANDTSI